MGRGAAERENTFNLPGMAVVHVLSARKVSASVSFHLANWKWLCSH